MENKKPMNFVLSPDWYIKDPIDFEHKEYVLNSFLLKVEEALSRGEIYPYFTEISLHLASIGNYLKSSKYVFINKEFTSCDDEVMIYELKSKKSRRKFTDQQLTELKDILISAQDKLLQYFAICRGIWDLSFESTSIKLRKNKKNLSLNKSYTVYQDLFNKEIYVWECKFEKISKKKHDTKILFNLIYKGNDKKFSKVIEENSETKDITYPIFEAFSTQNLPLEQTLLPLFKRKVQSYFTQTIK
jgi:hypothetical protein